MKANELNSMNSVIAGSGQDKVRPFYLQRCPKKFVLGCVNLPPQSEAESRNLGHTFLANSVQDCTNGAIGVFNLCVG